MINDLEVPDATIMDLEQWLGSNIWRDGDSNEINDSMPDSIDSLIRRVLEYQANASEAIVEEMRRCFGIGDTNSLIRQGSMGELRAVIRSHVPERDPQIEPYKYTLTVDETGESFQCSIPDDAPLHLLGVDNYPVRLLSRRRTLMAVGDDERRRWIAKDTLGEIASLIAPNTVRPLNSVAHYLPASRTGVMHAHRTVVASLVSRASRAGIWRDEPPPLLSGVLGDFLEKLIELGDLPRTGFNGDLARHIEEKILDGAILSKSSVASYPEFSYQPNGWGHDIPLMNTSSMVSELAPVVLYLRYVVRPGELLIIEEPESHLHPAMQVELVRQLAAVVRSGVRVMLTTHSEWVLDELTNLVRMSELAESLREGIGSADYALDHDEVGVWLFAPGQDTNGSVVKEIPFDVEFGGFRSRFDDVAMGTYNDYAEISSRVENPDSVEETDSG